LHPVIAYLGPFTITSYGVMVAVGVLVGLFVVLRVGRREGIDTDTLLDLALYMIAAGVVGARAAYVFLHWENFRTAPLEMLRFWDGGGLSFFGSLGLCLLVAIWFTRRRRLRLARVGDLLVLGVAAGYPFGRIGCFLNGCCYGLPTNHAFGIVFPFDEVARHPTQLYSFGFGVVIFLVLWRLSLKKPFDGYVMGFFLILYAAYRFVIDFWRVSPASNITELTVGQLVSLAVIAASGAFLYAARRRASSPPGRP